MLRLWKHQTITSKQPTRVTTLSHHLVLAIQEVQTYNGDDRRQNAGAPPLALNTQLEASTHHHVRGEPHQKHYYFLFFFLHSSEKKETKPNKALRFHLLISTISYLPRQLLPSPSLPYFFPCCEAGKLQSFNWSKLANPPVGPGRSSAN